jgi:hypothetical protein
MSAFINLIYMFVGMIVTLGAVWLGGWLVYRVKLPNESLLKLKPKGSVTYDDPFVNPPENVDGGKEIISKLMKANNKMRGQMDKEPLERLKNG